jgi:hypothetical protein
MPARFESARVRLAAHEAAQAAHGAAPAIEMAKRGEAWRAANVDEDADFIVAAKNGLRAARRGGS